MHHNFNYPNSYSKPFFTYSHWNFPFFPTKPWTNFPQFRTYTRHCPPYSLLSPTHLHLQGDPSSTKKRLTYMKDCILQMNHHQVLLIIFTNFFLLNFLLLFLFTSLLFLNPKNSFFRITRWNVEKRPWNKSTQTLIDLPLGIIPIGNIWVCKIKRSHMGILKVQ